MNAVVTICIPPVLKEGVSVYQVMAEMTHPTIKAYAERIGADFILINEVMLSTASPHFEKFQLFDLLAKYDRIIFMDTDLIVRDDCPNLFDIVPEHMVGMFDESPFRDNFKHLAEASQTYHIDIEKDYNGAYYNTGVMVVSRLHRDMFKLPATQSIFNHYDQSYLNLFIQANHVKVHKLPYQYNRMVLVDDLTGDHRLNSYIIHYAGILQHAEKIIENDLGRWKRGHRSIPKKAILAVGARLGDIVSAEPIIRHMILKEYPDYEITIVSTEPRVFGHLAEKAKLATFAQAYREEDEVYITKNCMLPQEAPIWQFMTANNMHTIDWMSINCLKHTLPDDEKEIRLAISLSGYAEVLNILGISPIEKLIVVHPGRGWPSKTFPAEYWLEICQKLKDTGCNVAIIGRDVEKEHGYVDFEAPEGVVDMRDLLSLDGLIALLSKAHILISNDSAPIHIAGAFDNHIILLPTCKHPDHVLPWRNGTKKYKTKALFKKPMWDEPCKNPLSLYGYNLSSVPGNINDFIADPQIILDTVKEILDG